MSRAWSPILLLIVSWGAVFGPALVRGHTFPARDAGATHIPWRAEAQRQLGAGHAPLWNPLANGGRPLLANPNAQVAYPPTLLLLPLGGELSLAASLALHHLFFLLGCFALARRAGSSVGAAGVAAAVVGFSGLPLSATLLPNLHASMAWGPWALATALPSDPPRRRVELALLGGVCLGLSFLAGEPLTAALIAVAFAVVVMGTQPRWAALLLPLAAAAAVGVAAPLLVPLLAFYRDTARAAVGIGPGALAADALAPRRWLELFLPHLLGDFHAATAPAFWAAPSFPWLRYFPALFVGILPLLLAPRAGFCRRTAPWWVLVVVGTGAAIFGGVAPLAQSLVIPHLRYAIKLLILPVLALPPLLALGWERLLAPGGPSPRRQAAGAAACLLPLLILAAFPNSLARPLLARFYPAAAATLTQVPSAALSGALILDASALGLPLLVLAAAPGAPLALAAAGAIGGVGATWGLLVSEPAAPWAAPPALAAGLPQGTRLATFAPRAVAPGDGGSALAPYQAMRAALLPNYPNRWGLGTLLERGPDGLESARHELLAAAAATLPLPQRVGIAAALGAPVAITAEELPGRSGECIAGVWRWRLEAAPEVYLARRLLPARGTLPTAVTLASPAFRPGWDAVVEGDGGLEELPEAQVVELPGAPHRRLFRVKAPAATLLVVQQSHMRCWQADIDGQRVPIVTVNGAMMGVWVPPGEHGVRLAIDPTPYRSGLAGPPLVLLALWLTRRGGAWSARGGSSGDAARNSPATPPAQ